LQTGLEFFQAVLLFGIANGGQAVFNQEPESELNDQYKPEQPKGRPTMLALPTASAFVEHSLSGQKLK
jgi:hypothetical protein